MTLASDRLGNNSRHVSRNGEDRKRKSEIGEGRSFQSGISVSVFQPRQVSRSVPLGPVPVPNFYSKMMFFGLNLVYY